MRGMRPFSVWSLVPVSVATIGVSAFLTACGGSGGGISPVPLSEQTVTQASFGVSRVLAIATETSAQLGRVASPPAGRSRSQCPRVRFPNSSTVVMDYGLGCSPDDGEYGRGQFEVALVGVRFDQLLDAILTGDLSDLREIRFTLRDFSNEAQGARYNGELRLAAGDRPNTMKLTYQLRANHSSSCWEQHAFEGSAAYSEQVLGNRFTLSGLGSYQSAAYGQFSVRFENLEYNSVCEYPVAGRIDVLAGAYTATLTFGGNCGAAQMRVNNGAPQTIDLAKLQESYRPCGGK